MALQVKVHVPDTEGIGYTPREHAHARLVSCISAGGDRAAWVRMVCLQAVLTVLHVCGSP